MQLQSASLIDALVISEVSVTTTQCPSMGALISFVPGSKQ